jgi:hypothetical protein
MSIKTMLKVCSVTAFFLVIFAALGSEKWIPRLLGDAKTVHLGFASSHFQFSYTV